MIRLPRALSLLALALALAGCDSNDDPEVDCDRLGLTDIGTVTATTPDGTFRATCGFVSISSGFFSVTAVAGTAPAGGPALDISLDGSAPGTYALGGDSFSGATYGRSLLAQTEAASGTVEITSLSGGARGTFSFTTVTGQQIRDGVFDLRP